MSTDALPLSDEDRAILALESETIAGHTCKVIVLGPGAPDAAAVRELIAGRIGGAPGLTRRLGGSDGAPEWVPDPEFDLAAHVVEAPGAEPLDAAGLREHVARRFEQRLDRDRPLWQLDVVPLAGGGAALVWRLHHAVADGMTTMRYTAALFWDEAPATPASGAAHAHATDDERRRAHLAGFLRREFGRSGSPSPFAGRVGTRREVAFATVPMGPLHDAAKAHGGASLNDAVLAAVGGGVRRWLEHHHGALGELRVKVPVSLHQPGEDAGNRDSFFEVGVPLDETDPVVRLEAVQAATAVRKAERDAEEMDALLAGLRRASPALARFCERVERSPRSFALNVSNVPGPRAPVSVLGTPVVSMHSVAEIAERHALRVAVVSCSGNLHFGLCADPEIVTGLDALAAGIEAEAAALSSYRV